jgi:hypothetical protein
MAGLDPQPVSTLALIADADGLVTWYPGVFTGKSRLDQATVKAVR